MRMELQRDVRVQPVQRRSKKEKKMNIGLIYLFII